MGYHPVPHRPCTTHYPGTPPHCTELVHGYTGRSLVSQRCLSGHDRFARLLLVSTVGLENMLIDSVARKSLKNSKIHENYRFLLPCESGCFNENGQTSGFSRFCPKSSKIHQKVVKKVVIFRKMVLKTSPYAKGEIKM